MRRTDLQAFAQAKIDDARLLLENRRWSNAYYLAGYTVELGLKACIARQISADTIPDQSILKGVLTHDHMRLIGLAGLGVDLKQEQNANPRFTSNWALVAEWSPDARYRAYSAMEAQFLYSAVSDADDGVLRWIKMFW